MDEDMDSTKPKTTESNYYTRSSLSRGYQNRSLQSLKKGKAPAKASEQLPSTRKRRSVSLQQTPTKMEDCPVPTKFPKTMENTHCWNCHKPKDVYPCDNCPRSFHIHCIKKEWSPSYVCNFCTQTESPLPSKTLCSYLKFVIQRLNTQDSELISTLNAVKPSEVFFHMDWSIIAKNIKKNYYKHQGAFLADVKWIYHNVLAYYSDRPLLVSTVKAMLKVCQEELAEMDACHYCYKNTHTLKKNWFTIPCENNHTLVWAKLKGFPFWPAKIMKINGDQADVRFFGGHERGLVPLEKCYLLSERSPVSLKGKAKINITNAMKEMKAYINELKGVKKFHYSPFQTRYNSQLAAQQITSIQSENDFAEKSEDTEQESMWHKKTEQDTDESANQTTGNDSEDLNQISSGNESMEDANSQELIEDVELNSESSYLNLDNVCDEFNVKEGLSNDSSQLISSNDEDSSKPKKVNKIFLKKGPNIIKIRLEKHQIKVDPQPKVNEDIKEIEISEVYEPEENAASIDHNVDYYSNTKDEPKIDSPISENEKNIEIQKEDNSEDLELINEEHNLDANNTIMDNFTSQNEDSNGEDTIPQDNLNLSETENHSTCNSVEYIDENTEIIDKEFVDEPSEDISHLNEEHFEENETEEIDTGIEMLINPIESSEGLPDSHLELSNQDPECELIETAMEESELINNKLDMVYDNEESLVDEVSCFATSDETIDLQLGNNILRIANCYTLKDKEDLDESNKMDSISINSDEAENSSTNTPEEQSKTDALGSNQTISDDSVEEDAKLDSIQDAENELEMAYVEEMSFQDSPEIPKTILSQEEADLLEAEEIAQIYSKIKRGKSIMDSQKLHTLNKEVKLNFFNYFKKRNSVIRARPYFRLNSLYYPTSKDTHKKQNEECFSEDFVKENILFNSKHKKNSNSLKTSSQKPLNYFEEAPKEEHSLDSEGTELFDSEDKLIEMEVNSIEKSKTLKAGKQITKELHLAETKHYKSIEESSGKLKNISSLPTWLKSQFSITVVKESSTEASLIPRDISKQSLLDPQNQTDSGSLEEQQVEVESKISDPSKEDNPSVPENDKELSTEKNNDVSKLKTGGCIVSKMKRTPLLKNREVSSPACEVTSTTITETSTGASQALATTVVKSSDSTAVKSGSSANKSDKTEGTVKHVKEVIVAKSKETSNLEMSNQWPKTTDQIQIIRLPFENSETSTIPANKSQGSTETSIPKTNTRPSASVNQPSLKSNQATKISNKIRDQVKRTLDERSTPPQTKVARHANSYFEPYMAKINQTLQSTLESMYYDVQENLPLVRQLKAELEQIHSKHKEELKDFAHARDMILSEMKASFELDKQRIISEMRHQFEVEKQKTVEETKKKQWCAVCGKIAMFYCCWNTSYCDYPCQRSHWPKHMETCTQTLAAQAEAKKTDMLPPVTSANQMRPKERGHDDDIQVVIHNSPNSRRPSDPSPRLMGASPHHSYYPSSMQMPPMVSNSFQYLSPNRQVAPPFITMGHSPMPPFSQSPHRMVSNSSRNSPMMNHPGNSSRLMMNGYPPYRTPYF